MTAAMSIFCSDTKPTKRFEFERAARQIELGRDHHLRVAAEHELAETDEKISQAEGGHEENDVGLIDQRPQHQPLDAVGEHKHDDDGERERDKRRHAVLVQSDERQRGEHHHDALGEIEHA